MTTVFNALEVERFLRGNGVNKRLHVRAASTAAVDLTGNLAGAVMDGVTLSAGNRILLKNQTDAIENGIYVVGSGAGTSYRAADLTTGDNAGHTTVLVSEGTTLQKTQWTCTATGAVVGNDSLPWTMSSRFNYAANDLFYGGSSSAIQTLSSVANRVLVTGNTGSISWSNYLPDATNIAAIPISGDNIANKTYVDSVGAGLDPKESVRVRTKANIGGTYNAAGGTGASGAFTGVNLTSATNWDLVGGDFPTELVIGNRVLVMNQTDAQQNGIYVVTTAGAAGALERAPDQDGTPANEVSGGNFTFVELGSMYANTGWVLQGDGVLTLNSNALNWVQFSGSASFNAKDGITINGADIEVDLMVNGGLAFNGSSPDGQLQVNLSSSAITGTVATSHGGTGLTTYSVGDLLLGTSGSLTTLGSIVRKALTTDNNNAGDVYWRSDMHLGNILGDSNSEPKLIEFDNSNSAVNHIKVANSLTTAPLQISAAGTDANVSLNLKSKGSGAIQVLGDSAAGTIRLFNSDDTYYAGIKAAAMASNVTWTLPLIDGSNKDLMRTDGLTVLSFSNPDATLRQVMPLLTQEAIADTDVLTPVAYFNWDQNEYGSVLAARIFFECHIESGKFLTVELYDEGAMTTFDGPHTFVFGGFHYFDVTSLPTASTVLAVRIAKNTPGGFSPQVWGLSMVFNPNPVLYQP